MNRYRENRILALVGLAAVVTGIVALVDWLWR